MLDLYTWGTPNGHKVHIMLEECDAICRLHPADINDKEAFAAIMAPLGVNRKIPLLIDSGAPDADPVTIFESGAILIHLAEKYRRFLSQDAPERSAAMQWLMFQMSAVGPMMGQLSHFRGRARSAPAGESPDAYALERFELEVRRIHSVMERHLQSNAYFAGPQYSIADMAIFPWLRLSEKLGIDVAAYPHLKEWRERIALRPAVQRALALPELTEAIKT
ncbi:glutathione binding-like protein [Diaphorobacter caeni]|uniref:glutathione binding-like protein n=1 Tax=Diaphorobacter caeni TaxID=2784387 RepID=UPI00188F0FBC|nr:glutathione binding-like protein [Diaphorobacter caeni]MBF5005746.1 glutathione S-transferase family protein [Diaphorobacter caeni]